MELLPRYSFALIMPSTSAWRSPFWAKYSLIFSRATSTTEASSTVLGTVTSLLKLPCTPFSTSSFRTLRRLLPERVLGIMPLPCMIPPREAIAPTWRRTKLWISAEISADGIASVGCSLVDKVMKAKGS